MSAEKPPRTDVTIRIDRAHGGRLEAIVQALRKQGLDDVAVRERFLIVNGSIPGDRVDDLRQVEGVASVRPDTTYSAKQS